MSKLQFEKEIFHEGLEDETWVCFTYEGYSYEPWDGGIRLWLPDGNYEDLKNPKQAEKFANRNFFSQNRQVVQYQ